MPDQPLPTAPIPTPETLGLGTAGPDACRDLGDVRRAIDRIDETIVGLLGLRLGYVLAAARFKPDAASIPAPERVAAMLPERRRWAERHGLNPDFVVPLFSQIIQWFIQQQVAHWTRARAGAQPDARPDALPDAPPAPSSRA
ncbi:isochorismate pyruvate lyase [Azospirillum agricola]|uniref:isochorismate lyase n=1 Tax=Azospirillum agricola TaxID=1720247 RepID=UPI001AE413B5|nr:isochorismate lyase [Azospirillum agricola]MBP2231641.1 isochorismate pyruvate lyase [Azospirillum agricola]